MMDGTYTYPDFMQNNTNPSGAPLRHGYTPSNNPASIWGDQKPAAQPVPLQHGYTPSNNPVPWGDQKPAAHPVPPSNNPAQKPAAKPAQTSRFFEHAEYLELCIGACTTAAWIHS